MVQDPREGSAGAWTDLRACRNAASGLSESFVPTSSYQPLKLTCRVLHILDSAYLSFHSLGRDLSGSEL